MLVTLIPFLLAAHLPAEDNRTWRHGVESVYTVHTSMVKTSQTTGVLSEHRAIASLHCVTKHHDILSCSLKQGSEFDNARGHNDDNGVLSHRKNVTEAPVDLQFDKDGIEKMIVDQRMRPYDLNVLRIVLEQLHTGDNFSHPGDGAYTTVAESSIGKCNVTLKHSRQKETDESEERKRDFRLEPVPARLRMRPGEKIVIEKRTNLDNCSCYADNYYRKYGNTKVSDRIDADLESMISYMEISETDFISSTTRRGMIYANKTKYNVVETTTVILEDIKPAIEKLPAIPNPVETKLIANYDMEKISHESRQ